MSKTIKCPKCKKEFNPSEAPTVTIEPALAADIEIQIDCPTTDCDQRFYTFVAPDFVAFEN